MKYLVIIFLFIGCRKGIPIIPHKEVQYCKCPPNDGFIHFLYGWQSYEHRIDSLKKLNLKDTCWYWFVTGSVNIINPHAE
jgi:hypothetical protein